MDKYRLFLDMDGTIAVFKEVDTLETLYEEGYFKNLAPIPNVINAVKEIIKNYPDIEVNILSAIPSDSKYAATEKDEWLDMYLPEVNKDHRIFTICGEDKKNFIEGGVRETDFLLDDYTKNLTLWQPPARGIKILNGINHSNGTWQHDRIKNTKSSKELAENLVDIMHHGKQILDENITSIESVLDKEDSNILQQSKNNISQKIKVAGFKANDNVVNNILKLDKLFGKEHSIKDIKNLQGSGSLTDNSEAKNLLINICNDFKSQEIEMKIVKVTTTEPSIA